MMLSGASGTLRLPGPGSPMIPQSKDGASAQLRGSGAQAIQRPMGACHTRR